MIYEYKCEKCAVSFTKQLAVVFRNKPLNEPCPSCGAEKSVFRDYATVTHVNDTIGVQARARQAAGSGWTEVLKRMHKGSGKHSNINV